ncbi:FAD-dependent oxidoreductase [Actinoplanes siamensis]|uniref:3-(3-hydroxyphenyl)propionate hydroxylase n=1 Tax=Actinoplanes siamensis TaxID=1223317 RepID=A0A919NEJ7_9ACTN|nr:FAD-dependent oxidoreductase [Actinoplanes siamensis]GIF09135.1 3-(3-hydroxyphenyl)propionate hydroxylase [Actinoplanes siamensis]
MQAVVVRDPVLIVGAGPAGLVTALEFTRRDIDVRIIDRSSAPAGGSRAKGIQPRTLEILESLGVVDAVLEAGGPFPRWRSYRAGQVAWEKSIYELLGIEQPAPIPAVPYPETWMIPQWRTQEILTEALAQRGVRVEYGSALTGLDDDGAGVTATVQQAGQPVQIRASYVVAADGAASVTRTLLGVAFDGITRDDERYLTADVRTSDLDRMYWHNWASTDNPAARVSICPLPGTDVFQFVAPLLPGDEIPELTLATIQRLFDERCEPASVTFDEVLWITAHRANERLADRFRQGRVFLVGDAAHTVPAAGGQGMNTAIGDSHNLVWKLAAVLRGAPDHLLDSYELERRLIAARLMNGLGVADENGETPDIFQLRDHYRASPLSVDVRDIRDGVRAGDRAPDGSLTTVEGSSLRLYDITRDTDLTVLAFGGTDARYRDSIAAGMRVMAIRIIDVDGEFPSSATALRASYGLQDGARALFVIRPDGHIGLAADDTLTERLEEYLRQLFHRDELALAPIAPAGI